MTIVFPLVEIFRYGLQPIAPFTWFGIGINTLDVLGAFRLCIILRQIKEALYAQHVRSSGAGTVEEESYVKNVATTLTVVYGGEAMTGSFLHSSFNLFRA